MRVVFMFRHWWNVFIINLDVIEPRSPTSLYFKVANWNNHEVNWNKHDDLSPQQNIPCAWGVIATKTVFKSIAT